MEDSALTSNPTLAAAQLVIAKQYLQQGHAPKALPYLQASLQENDLLESRTLLRETFDNSEYSLPTHELRHPFPVLRFTASADNLYVALGGPHPTVIRWNLRAEPVVQAVLFPTPATSITHLSICPNGRYLLVHRDGLNLLCEALSLKPIIALDAFSKALDPDTCQAFSANSLLLATPTDDTGKGHIWRIRDAATGEILRSEWLPSTFKPTDAHFDNTTLVISHSDGKTTRIPLQGDVIHAENTTERNGNPPSNPDLQTYRVDGRSIRLHRTLHPESEQPTAELLDALCGYRLDHETQTLREIPSPNRLEIISRHMPGILPETFRVYSAEPQLTTRLAAAFPDAYPDITAPARAHAKIISDTFASRNREAIESVIDAASPGLPIATALFHAIDSGDVDFIDKVTGRAGKMPQALQILARGDVSSLADFNHLKRVEDWQGFEAPDFQPLLNRIRSQRHSIIRELELPPQPSEQQVTRFTRKLFEPETLRALGGATAASTALQAAHTLSGRVEHTHAAIHLADRARQLGASLAATMRIRARVAFTLSDFESSHQIWIDLITRQPEADQLATDYAEAAHSAFEIGNPRQAIEILNTGLFRFPRDVAFAIRASWIALLTHHDEEALRYLSQATLLGLPPSDIENTTALHAIAYQRLGDYEKARAYHAQLIAISPRWNEPASLDKLPWPEPFKESLREIISDPPETEPLPSPENDPTNTAPLPEESTTPEPPLPSR